jgi:imidazolonepropionase-like amidohydrolase
MAVPARRGHAEGRVAVDEAGRLEHERGPARVDGRLHLGTGAELRAATCVAAELLRAEGQLEALAAGAHADVIVLEGDPLEDIGLLADPAAHMPLAIQAGAVVRQR